MMNKLVSTSCAATAVLLTALANARAEDIPQPRACTLTCPAKVTATTGPDRCAVIVTYAIATTGACTVVQTAGLPSGSEFPVGTTTNAFRDDASMATCSFTVTVEDNSPPVLICPSPDSVVARVGSDCMAEVPDFRNLISGSDNCLGPEARFLIFDSQDPPAGTKVGPGSTPVTITVSDSRNSATCTYDLNVERGCGCGMCGTGAAMPLAVAGPFLLAATRGRRRQMRRR